MLSSPAFQKHSCSLQVPPHHRQKQRGSIVAHPLLPAANLKVRIGPGGHEHTNNACLPLDGSAETMKTATKHPRANK